MSINLTFILQLLNIWFAIFLLKKFFLRPLMSLVKFEKEELNVRLAFQNNKVLKLNDEIVNAQVLLQKNRQLLQEKYIKMKVFLEFKSQLPLDLSDDFQNASFDENTKVDVEFLRQTVVDKLEGLL